MPGNIYITTHRFIDELSYAGAVLRDTVETVYFWGGSGGTSRRDELISRGDLSTGGGELENTPQQG